MGDFDNAGHGWIGMSLKLAEAGYKLVESGNDGWAEWGLWRNEEWEDEDDGARELAFAYRMIRTSGESLLLDPAPAELGTYRHNANIGRQIDGAVFDVNYDEVPKIASFSRARWERISTEAVEGVACPWCEAPKGTHCHRGKQSTHYCRVREWLRWRGEYSCSEDHTLPPPTDDCGQRWCEECQAWMNLREEDE